MPDYTVHKASDLGQDERLLFERWLGRALSSDETISVNAWRPHSPPSGVGLETLRRDIISQAVEIGSRASEMAPEEIDRLVEEARRLAAHGFESHPRFQCPGSRGNQPTCSGVASS